MPETLDSLRSEIVDCRKCPRLVEYREAIGKAKKKTYENWNYWSRPVPGYGDPNAQLLIVGLAPAAHGGNRTGRVFTGDKSGDFLTSALHETGFANQLTSTSRNDGLKLSNVYLTAAVKCAPPDNKPTATESENCLPYLQRELQLLKNLKAVLCLGQFGYNSILKTIGLHHKTGPTPKFSHGLELTLRNGRRVYASYHPSPRNTQTGKLSMNMFLSLLRRIRKILNPRGQA